MFALLFLLSEQIHIRVLFFAYIALSRDNKFLASLFKLCYFSLSIADDNVKPGANLSFLDALLGLLWRPVSGFRKLKKSQLILILSQYGI